MTGLHQDYGILSQGSQPKPLQWIKMPIVKKNSPTDRFTLDQLKCFPLCVHCDLLRFPQSFQIRLESSQNGGDVRMDVIYVVIRGAGDATTHPMPYVQTCSKQALETHVQTLYHQKRVTICDNKLNS